MDKSYLQNWRSGLAINLVSNLIGVLVGAAMTFLAHSQSPWTGALLYGAGAWLLTFAILTANRVAKSIPVSFPPTDVDNVELRIRGWLDNFGLSVKRDPIADAHFRYVVKTEGDLKIILGRLKNDLSSYVLLRVEVGPTGDEDKKALASLTDEEKISAMTQIKLELNRAKIGYAGFNSLEGLVLTKRIPISSSLTENVLIDAIGEIEAAYHLVFLTASLFMAQRTMNSKKISEVSA